MYAAVNVEQYNIVATAATQSECIAKYDALITGKITAEQATSDAVPETVSPMDLSSFEERTITIAKKEAIVQDGNTYLYIADEEGNIYRARYTDVIGMMLTDEGDTVTIRTDGEWFMTE